MKNTILFGCLFLFILSLTSCGSGPNVKHKGCNGKGGWYGYRNLSKVDTKKLEAEHYVWKIQDNKVADF